MSKHTNIKRDVIAAYFKREHWLNGLGALGTGIISLVSFGLGLAIHSVSAILTGLIFLTFFLFFLFNILEIDKQKIKMQSIVQCCFRDRVNQALRDCQNDLKLVAVEEHYLAAAQAILHKYERQRLSQSLDNLYDSTRGWIDKY